MQVSPHEFGKVLTENWEDFEFNPPDDKSFDVGLHGSFIISENGGSTIYVLTLN